MKTTCSFINLFSGKVIEWNGIHRQPEKDDGYYV